MAGEPSASWRRKPIGEWPRGELWVCATSVPAGAVVVVAVTLSGEGHYYGDWDRWVMGAILTFLVACSITPFLLRFSIPAGRELRRRREPPSAVQGTSPVGGSDE